MISCCILFSFLILINTTNSQNAQKVTYLDAGDIVLYTPESPRKGFFQNDIRIYCHRGNSKTIGRIFETIQLQLEIDNDDFTQYDGESPEVVKSHYEEQKSIFSINLFTQKKTRRRLNPFSQECIGMVSTQPYRVRLHLIRVDFWKVIQMLLGLFVFSFAAKLSQNSVFYYIIGVLIGIFSSFMLLIYLAGKLFPKRPMMYGVLIGGWAIGIYIIQMLWENLQIIVVTYQAYVFWYILVTGFISFIFCYRLGPPKNKRSKDLIKWGLQLISLICVYFSSQFEEASTAIIIITFVIHYFPRSWLQRVRLAYLRRFPPKRRLLSSEEYYEQGVRETTKALEELRQFCSSPDCKQWRTMTKLKDPMRFAAFVEGASHIEDREILQYEGSMQGQFDSDLSEDDDDESVNSCPPGSRHKADNEESSGEDEVDAGYRSTSTFSSTVINGRGKGRISVHNIATPTNRYVTGRRFEHQLSEDDDH